MARCLLLVSRTALARTSPLRTRSGEVDSLMVLACNIIQVALTRLCRGGIFNIGSRARAGAMRSRATRPVPR